MGQLLDVLMAELEYGPSAVPAVLAVPIKRAGAKPREPQEPQPVRLQKLFETDGQARLLAAIRSLNLPDSMLGRFDASDADVGELTDRMLKAYVRAAFETEQRFKGEVPADETATALCHHCGPVWAAPEVAAVAPLINNTPQLLGCPWCQVRKAGVALPRPSVTCGSCRHFIRDALNPNDGMGRCSEGIEPARPWPNAQHRCGSWRPLSD